MTRFPIVQSLRATGSLICRVALDELPLPSCLSGIAFAVLHLEHLCKKCFVASGPVWEAKKSRRLKVVVFSWSMQDGLLSLKRS